MIVQPKPGSHLYGRGFLGLIPLIGFFVGGGLIALGIFKYRNAKLSLIGVAALIPSILIYGFLFIYTLSPSGKQRWTAFCKPNLDQLVKNIEFYRKEHGVYPDSLEQLTKEQQFVPINDPVQAFTKTKFGNKYFYRAKAGKYILFSMGVDGEPYTKDDIFPTDKYFDSTLTGLVKPDK